MPSRVQRKDVRVLVTAVAQFAASFETQLRQIEPALTLSQLVALERIANHPKLRPFQLATQMRISRQLAWQTCKRLEALGLLSMGNMTAGKRGIEVEATDAGAAHLRQVGALHAAIAAALGTGNEALDLGAVRSGLHRLTAATAQLGKAGEDDMGDEAADGPRRRRARKTAVAAGDRASAAPCFEGEESAPRQRRSSKAD